MLREPDFLKDVNEADIRKNYEEPPSSTEEESLTTLKGIRNIYQCLRIVYMKNCYVITVMTVT